MSNTNILLPEEEKREQHYQIRKGYTHCRSLYHHPWFRILLVLVSIDMIVLGFCYAIGINVFSLLPQPALILRIIIGFLYIISALAVIHYVFEYERMKEGISYICYKCIPGFDEVQEKQEKE